VEVFDECDECNGTGLYFIDEEPVTCICFEEVVGQTPHKSDAKIERFDVPRAGTFIVTEDGHFVAYTSSENVMFHWGGYKNIDRFKEFLIQVAGSRGYLKSKFFKPIYDHEASVVGIRSEILRQRRNFWLSKEDAREEMNLVNDLYVGDIGFEQWANETKISDPWDSQVFSYTYHQNKFVDEYFQEFARFLKSDMFEGGL
jgi:hypothetical protein